MKGGCERKEFFNPRWSLAGFWRDTNASTAVETGLIFLLFISLLGSIVDAGMLYFRQAQLQLVTDIVSRSALVNTLPAQAASPNSVLTYGEFIKRNVCTWQTGGTTVQKGTLGKMFDCSRVLMSVQSFPGWGVPSNIFSAPYPQSAVNVAIPQPGNLVVVKIGYPVKTFFNFFGKDITLVEGVAVFRAEPGA